MFKTQLMQSPVSLKIIVSLLILSAFYSCQQSDFKGFASPVNFGKSIHVVCDADTTQSYELYLPSSYNTNKTWPIIVLFDSHANGQLAIDKFREAAETFGYVLAASNNSRNGIPNTLQIGTNLLNDVEKKYKVDSKRIYAAGFSGGGRVAFTMALSNSEILGVISCSAGLPNINPQMESRKFDIYGIAGMEDFNFQEVASIPQALAGSGWTSAIDLFDGSHAWPPARQIWKAVLWTDLNAIKKGLRSKDTKMIDVSFDTIMSMTNQFVHHKRFLLAQQQCQWAIEIFTGLKNPKPFSDKLDEIKSSPGYISELNNAQKLQEQEAKLRDAYLQNFIAQDTIWWKNELSVLKEEMTTTNDILYKQMLSRTKGFLGIVAYSYTSEAISNTDLAKASRVIALYKILEPENPDAYFFEAQLFDKKGKTNEAVKALKQALKLGFADQEKIRSAFSKEVIGKLE